MAGVRGGVNGDEEKVTTYVNGRVSSIEMRAAHALVAKRSDLMVLATSVAFIDNKRRQMALMVETSGDIKTMVRIRIFFFAPPLTLSA